MGFKTKYYSGLILILGIAFSALNTNASEVNKDTVLNISYIEPPKKTTHLNYNEVNCLAEAVYYESKNQPINGQHAVGHVIVNRTKNPKFPNTVCKVINQRNNSGCQFSYKCVKRINRLRNDEEYKLAINVAINVLNGESDMTKGAIYFHNNSVKPVWAKSSKLTAKIGNHKFYKG